MNDAPLRLRRHEGLAQIPAAAWDRLRPDDNPFLSHAFLEGLERHGCIQPELGWQPWHLTAWRGEELVGALPCYAKGNSHGEFVFDWSWAEAYARYGLDYYPKLLAGVPYSPVTGPRLLAADDAVARGLLDGLREHCGDQGFSSAHVNFVAAAQARWFGDARWLERNDWQFHWHDAGYRDFDDFLAALQPKKRKNLRQERAKVAAQGVQLTVLHGDELDEDDWRFVYDCYVSTFEHKGNYPALSADFLRHLGRAMPRSVVVFLARRQGRRVAMALCLRSADTLYGRYWGCSEEIPGLHFETCYYQGIEYCLRHRLRRFEPGAQGQHKIARGFLPRRTRSFHYIARQDFRTAIASALRREHSELQHWGAQLAAQSPFLHAPAEPAP